MGSSAISGVTGNCHALAPTYGCATGTCCCQLVMPTIIWCSGSPWDSTSQRSPVMKVFTEAAKAAKPASAASVAPW